METIRHFSGSRGAAKPSVAKEILKIEIQKKGKLPAQMRYKMIFKRRQEEMKEKAVKESTQANLNSASSMVSRRKMSSKAEQALKEVAMKKAAKEAKALRQMVVIQPRNFYNGSLNKKGFIYDIAGNVIGKVNSKNGAMTTNMGWAIGKYKPKSYMTRLLIEQAIDKHSPYFIRQRLLLAQQQALAGGVHGAPFDPNVMNVHGISAQASMLGGGAYGHHEHNDNYGVHGRDDINSPNLGSNAAFTAWGGVSNNVWGGMSGNVHGTMADNVFGTANADVWGAVGGGGMWGVKSVRLYGTGSGENHLTGITKWILGIFGYQSKAAREAVRQSRALRAALAQGGATSSRSSGGGSGGSAVAGRRR